MPNIVSTEDVLCEDGVEKTIIDWTDVRDFQGDKSLFVENTGATEAIIKVYQGDFVPKKSGWQVMFEGRIDYDLDYFKIPAGQEKRMPIYDDGISETLKVTGTTSGGDTTIRAKITGPKPTRPGAN